MKDSEFLVNNGVDLESALNLLGDISLYNDTLKDFLEENKTRLPNIAKYRKEGNLRDYTTLVHSLKSDAKYLGFTDLAEVALQHEMAGNAGDMNTINISFNQLVSTYNKYARIAFDYLGLSTTNTLKTEPNDFSQTSKIEIPKKIIVADDSRIISNIVVKAFEGVYDVLVAENGQEAINYTMQYSPKAIVALLLDLNMPEVDGFAVLDYFKASNLFSEIPVCIITGDVEKDRIDRAFTYDIIDVLPKPFTIENVQNIVEKIKH